MSARHPLLFRVDELVAARRFDPADAPLLQAFLEANPEYFERIGGAPPKPDEAATELAERPPAELSWHEHFNIGLWREAPDTAPALIGIAIVDSDLVIEGCWHVALFIIATALHGQGIAPRCYRALEQWAAAQGARWIRLGVVLGNARAEAFWRQLGFVELRRREGVPANDRLNTVRVLLKPLREPDVAPYLALVARDRPE
ncbi:GNAT family N-acetyltransferase [Paucibacter sp. O1-1]|nr:GNAT family N-acetyltransferase [Paucibacter sp. O1-1]MDA3827030.1 GNAT family N-acetyltransferase [Paucibacter sp. O1-1]